MVEAIIFDSGGVIHTDPMKEVHKDIAQTLGITDEEETRIWREVHPKHGEGKTSVKEFWQEFLEKSGVQLEVPQDLLLREYVKGFKRNEGVLEIVKKLKIRGYKVAILSNSIAPHAEFNHQVGIYDEFPIRILSHEVGVRKPDPEIYRLALKELGIEPQEAIYVDDNDDNVEAARKLGMSAIKYEDPGQLRSALSESGVQYNNHA